MEATRSKGSGCGTGASSCVCRMARITATQVTIWMGNPFLSRWEDHLLSPGKATPARADGAGVAFPGDRKSTRLNSSHHINSYAVYCLTKKKINTTNISLH